jgi:hypothetical protein
MTALLPLEAMPSSRSQAHDTLQDSSVCCDSSLVNGAKTCSTVDIFHESRALAATGPLWALRRRSTAKTGNRMTSLHRVRTRAEIAYLGRSFSTLSLCV